jgi:hypothetical protein
VLISRKWAVYLLLAAMGLSFPVGELQAGWFEFSNSKRPVTNVKRGQSSDPAISGSDPIAPPLQPGNESVPQGFYDNSQVPMSWGYDSSPCFESHSRGLFRCCTCCEATMPGGFNCGANDHYIDCTKFHRRKCGETWYPRVAPYCQPSWGWTQPCWRRATDNYNCLRPETPPTRSPQRAPQPPVTPPTVPHATVPPPAPVLEPPPPPPAETNSMSPTSRTNVVNRSTGSPQIGRASVAGPASVAQQSPVRISSFGYTSLMEDPRNENPAVETDAADYAAEIDE